MRFAPLLTPPRAARALVGACLALALCAPAAAQEKPKREGTATLMAGACAAVDAAACRAKVERALGKGESFQLVVLQGCLAEYSRSDQGGAAAVVAAKQRANACLEAAVRGAPQLSPAEITPGQETLRKRPHLAGASAAQFAQKFRTEMTAVDTKCARIKHMYTRYNCYTKRLHNFMAQPE